ncbi:6-phosphogluconolactonase [Marinobacterium arenosum]|uniref:6-phosphogluconolactonase n=1 Tax=Marinobacterium arenosum TaxID=2862496 RepID=UPI001C94B62F|nr:6-phosphogluconolactonase [Marinobacterium arenosum]MBY4677068.1 6-phosphogluconolactonase [Marinobacterium arenosum]
MNPNELNLPAQLELRAFRDRATLTEALATDISQQLEQAIKQDQQAALAVSGGRTPIALFERLSQSPLDWQRVQVTLVDDRWLSPDQPDSNERLVRQHLLQNQAAAARFVGLWQPDGSAAESVEACNRRLEHVKQPLDLAILGMGNDGHTASLFPCAEQLQQALDSERHCAAVIPGTAPHERMTLTAQRLLASRQRVLHLTGEDKLETLARALAGDEVAEMPIRLFLQQPLTLYWAP